MKPLVVILFIGALTGCASKSVEQLCPSALEEPVSVCRAEYACKGSGFKKGLAGFAAALGGAGAAASKGPNKAQQQMDNCVKQNLAAQKANAGLSGRDISCTSSREGNEVQTDCSEY